MRLSRFALPFAAVLLTATLPAYSQQEIGPLAPVVNHKLLTGWQASSQDGWFVLRNDTLEESEQTLMIPAGPPPAQGRVTTLNVSLNSVVPNAAIGILSRSPITKDLCLIEVTADAKGNLFCIVGGEYQSIASVDKAARLDGSDLIEMIEWPGKAAYYINDTKIGEVTYASALGADQGIMAYERGVFGLADFDIVDLPAPASTTGSGLPPKGGVASGGGAAQPAATSGGGNADVDERMVSIMGPLASAITPDNKKEGWEVFYENDWIVLVNSTKASSEQFYTVPVGPVSSGQRTTRLEVGILPPAGENAADFPKSAVGILIEGNNREDSCIGEITGAKEALVLCFGADGSATEAGSIANAARGDGSDVLEFVEEPGVGEFRINGQPIARLQDHPAMGGDIGVLAYERGEFYMGGFNITTSSGSAPSQSGQSTAPSSSESPLPMFGHDSNRIVGVYLGITNGIFMHEFGHALIGELELPATGPEEDAVDIFSALRVVEPTMYPSGDPDTDAIGREVAIYAALQWYYSGLLGEQAGATTPWQDEHTADLKRFRNVFCVIYGGNPGLYSDIAELVDMDERTLGRCESEFTRQNRAWRSILAPHTRVGEWHPEGLLPADAPGASIEVIFEPSSSAVGQLLIEAFADGLRGFADDLASTYALPRDLKVIYQDCGELNAWYSQRDATITMCYDLVEYLAVMVSDIEMGTKGGMPADGVTGGASAPAAATKAKVASAAEAPSPNAIDEFAELGVPRTNVLFPSPYRGATPASHSRAEMIDTAGVVDMLTGGGKMLLIDTSGNNETIPGSMLVTDAGQDGSLTDSFQPIVSSWLDQETEGNKSMPIVFFGGGLQDRSSYNAALRAGNLGWNVYWYRGGLEAWRSNGLPVDQVE